MLKLTSFKWIPFSIKQWKLLTWWIKNSPIHLLNGIIAEGAIRAGKSAPMSFSFTCWAMRDFDQQNFILAGKTIGSLRRNVVAPLKRMLLGRGMICIDHRADNMSFVNQAVGRCSVDGSKLWFNCNPESRGNQGQISTA
jgi:hypothetical protein